MDFTRKKYDLLCSQISSSSKTNLTFGEYFARGSSVDNFVILRHDVDASPRNALSLALIEKKYGLKSTYYFRKKNLFLTLKL